jgi:hypothetical protein
MSLLYPFTASWAFLAPLGLEAQATGDNYFSFANSARNRMESPANSEGGR